jgi:DNA-binding CsgD family transcriptional regulator
VARASIVEAVEAAYDLSGSNEAWLMGVLGALDRQTFAHRAVISAGWCFEGHAISDVTVARGPAALPALIYALHGRVPPDRRGPTYAPIVLTGLHSMRVAMAHLGITPDPLGKRLLSEGFDALGVHDFHVLPAHDLGVRGCLLGWGMAGPTSIDPQVDRRLTAVSVHLNAGHRLRGRATPEEAVLDGDRVVHAEGEAKDAREVLRGAARALDRARLRGTDPDEALELWQGLVDGRWSLVDRFDSDGRRFLVARRNDDVPAEPRALSPRERSVLAHAARGHSNKLIGYELGISESAAANHVASLLKKLGLPSRAALAGLVSQLGPPGAVE